MARSLGAGGYGEYASLEAALATCQIDVVVEVTGPESVEPNVRTALERGIGVVAGATGIADDRWQALGALAAERNTRLHQVANFAIGAVLMMRFAAAAAEHMPAAAIIEEHHADEGRPSQRHRPAHGRPDRGTPVRRGPRSTPSACRASSPTRRSCSARWARR